MNRLRTQGYTCYTDDELRTHRFGIRFAYAVCAALVLSGLILTSLPLLIVAAAVAFLGVFPPYHPVDYLYNYGIRFLLRKPRLPHRTPQTRFACAIATAWLIATILFFYHGYTTIGYVFGTIIVCLATLVSTTDICIPSMVYNGLFRKK